MTNKHRHPLTGARLQARDSFRTLPPAGRKLAAGIARNEKMLSLTKYLPDWLKRIPQSERGMPITELGRTIRAALNKAAEARAEKRRREFPRRPMRKTYPGTPAERREQLVRDAVWLASPMRAHAPGGTTVDVRMVNHAALVGYVVKVTLKYDVYGGRNLGRPAIHDTHTIAVMPNWRRTVQRRGLVGDKKHFVLHAEPVTLPWAPDHVQTFFAVWVEQGRGYAVSTKRGLLARSPGGTLAFGELEPMEDFRQGEAARKAIRKAARAA